MAKADPAQSERGADIKVWQEPSGYWSASLVVRVPVMADWDASATSFHDAGEALEWARGQIELAVFYG